MQKTAEKTGLNERINDFVQKNRTPIFVSLGLIVLVIAGFIISISIIDAVRKNAISAVEELSERYDTLRPFVAEDPVNADLETLVNDLETFAKKTNGYSGGRAWAIIAAIHSERKEWGEAETAWAAAAQTAKKTYLEPLAWFNAGASAEEQSKNDEALEYYANSLAANTVFPAAAQAQFSIGRLKESGGDKDGALEAYRTLISDRSYDTIWVNFAHSRIIALEAQAE